MKKVFGGMRIDRRGLLAGSAALLASQTLPSRLMADTPLSSYLGVVATRCQICSQGGVDRSVNWGASSVSIHWLRDDVTALKLVYWNGFVDSPRRVGGIERGLGAPLRIRASVGGSGARHQALWAGSDEINIPEFGIAESDWIAVTAEAGERIEVHTDQFSLAGALFFDQKANAGIGDRLAFDGGGRTMSGEVENAIPGYTFTPAAIVAMTRKRSVFICGTSRTYGSDDTPDKSGDMGTIARSIGPHFGYINAGIPADMVSKFLASNTKRLALASYCSDVIIDHGANDDQRTIRDDLAKMFALFPRHRVSAATQSPHTIGAWSKADGSDQTVDIDMTELRRWLLSKPVPVHALFDVNAVCALEGDERKWKPGYTPNGIHENYLANIAIRDSGAVRL